MKINPKQVLSDSIMTILGLVIMNITAQFMVYPSINRVLGSAENGTVLYIMGAVNIIAVSCGATANLARIVSSVREKTYNIDPAVWLGTIAVITLPALAGVLYAGTGSVQFGQLILSWLLAVLTTWRFYVDVEFRLRTNYKGYFVYYLCISAGYALGVFLFRVTKCWQLAFIPGELGGLLYVWKVGSVMQYDGKLDRQRFLRFLRSVISLMVAQLLSNVVFNADRFVLMTMVSAQAVTIYYIASLIGKTITLITTPLNSVIIGYLAKMEKTISRSLFLKISLLGVCLSLLALAVCVLGSHIFSMLFYPQEASLARQYFVMANLAQIIYFATGILTTIMLRYLDEKYQIYLNVSFAVVFVSVTIFATKFGGMHGFTIALVLVNAFRYLLATIIGAAKLKDN